VKASLQLTSLIPKSSDQLLLIVNIYGFFAKTSYLNQEANRTGPSLHQSTNLPFLKTPLEPLTSVKARPFHSHENFPYKTTQLIQFFLSFLL